MEESEPVQTVALTKGVVGKSVMGSPVGLKAEAWIVFYPSAERRNQTQVCPRAAHHYFSENLLLVVPIALTHHAMGSPIQHPPIALQFVLHRRAAI